VLPDGTKIKAGGMVTYVPYSMGRMEYNWGPNAASFIPERWFKDGVLKNESPFKFTAFQVNNLTYIFVIYNNILLFNEI
jgi:cytochrome P450